LRVDLRQSARARYSTMLNNNNLQVVWWVVWQHHWRNNDLLFKRRLLGVGLTITQYLLTTSLTTYLPWHEVKRFQYNYLDICLIYKYFVKFDCWIILTILYFINFYIKMSWQLFCPSAKRDLGPSSRTNGLIRHWG